MRFGRAVLRAFWNPASPEAGRKALRELAMLVLKGAAGVVWTVVVIAFLSWWIYGPWDAVGRWLNDVLPKLPPLYFGLPESTWAYILGITFSTIIVGSVVGGLIREARLRRRLRREQPELFAEVQAEQAAYRANQEATVEWAYRRELPTNAAVQFVEARQQSLWSEVGRFLSFWRHRISR